MTLDEAVKRIEDLSEREMRNPEQDRLAMRTLLAAVRPEKKSLGRVFVDAAYPDDIGRIVTARIEAGAAAVLRECAVTADDLEAELDPLGMHNNAAVISAFRRIQERKGVADDRPSINENRIHPGRTDRT